MAIAKDISSDANSPDLVLVQTAGERARQALAGGMPAFVHDIPQITDADLLPVTNAVDWENPKSTLFNHPGVKKTIRIVASVAAVAQKFELEKFDCLYPKKFISEIEAELKQCTDSRAFSKLESRADAFLTFLNTCPATVAELRDYAEIYRCNVDFSVCNLIKFCREIAGEWFEVIPAGSVRELLAELGSLQTASLPDRLAWFGLADFAPMEAGK